MTGQTGIAAVIPDSESQVVISKPLLYQLCLFEAYCWTDGVTRPLLDIFMEILKPVHIPV